MISYGGEQTMLEQYDDILTISELAEFLKIGTTQA